MTKCDGRVLKDYYKDYFKIGVACEKINGRFTNHEIGNPAKEELMHEQFGSMTFANELKPAYNMGFASPEAKEDYLPFVINPVAKDMLDWARTNHMKVRGHVLVWHSQCADEAFCKGYKPVRIPTDPELLKERPFLKHFEKLDPICMVDRDTMLKRLESYITSLMEYMYANDYMNTIYAWDVVNEAIELLDKTETGLRNSYWYRVIGDDFIYWAFRFAKKAVCEMSAKYAAQYGVDANDGKALRTIQPKLFYNDYNEFDPEKKKAIIGALTREGHGHGSIIGEGLIDGIGMQGHLSDNNNIDDYYEAVMDYGKLVDEIHVTELDVKCTAVGVNKEYYQALFYKEFFEMLLKARQNNVNVSCVTFWGLTDDNSWIRGADPLLFNADLSPKKAYDAVIYATTGESLGDPEPVTIDLSDRMYDFENVANPEDIGFKMKGFGQFVIQDKVSHSGSHAIENPFRGGDWCGVAMDVSDFIGQTVQISAWVMCKAPKVYLKADLGGDLPVIGSADTTENGWSEIKCEYKIPSDIHSLQLFFSTDTDDKGAAGSLFIDDVSVKLVGQFESFEEATNIAAIRGMGHLPFLAVTDKESVDGKSHSLMVTRHEKDATVKLNVSSYIGHKIAFEAFVKTADKVIKVGLDGSPSIECATFDSKGDWTRVNAEIDLPADLRAAEVYIETDQAADFYVDEVSVKLA